MTRLLAIIGDPVAQARSPEVFNALFRDRGVDAVMVPMQVTATDLPQALRGLQSIGNLQGAIVTIPHKPAAAALADEPSDRVRLAGAANALKLVDGRWVADLFDGEGFVLGLLGQGFEVSGLHCAMVGAGGAGAAIALALLARPIASLTIWDADRSRCARIVERLLATACVPVHIGLPGRTTDLAINATPLGMRQGDPLPFAIEELRPDAIVADAIMKPPVTNLLEKARSHGCRIQPGRYMLDAQVDALWHFFELPGTAVR